MGTQLEMGVREFKRVLDSEELKTEQLEQVIGWLGMGLWSEQGGSISRYENHLKMVLRRIEREEGEAAFVNMSPYIIRDITHCARMIGDERVLKNQEEVIKAIPQKHRADARNALNETTQYT
jgi:hypothetical protein